MTNFIKGLQINKRPQGESDTHLWGDGDWSAPDIGRRDKQRSANLDSSQSEDKKWPPESRHQWEAQFLVSATKRWQFVSQESDLKSPMYHTHLL